MLVRERSTFAYLFTFTGSILPAVAPHVFFGAIMGAVACLINNYGFRPIGITFAPLGVFGVALSLFLGFRNSASYDRWWEARKQWGAQIIAARNLGKIIRTTCGDHPDGINIMRYVSAHSHAMRFEYTNNPDAGKDYQSFLSEDEILFVTRYPNVADAVLYLISEAIRRLHKADPPVIDSICLVAIQDQVSQMVNVQTACDRLVSAPIPFTYSMMVYRTTVLFVLIAPFSMVQTEGWWTVGMNSVIAYMFFGLDELGHRLENPFDPAFTSSMPLTALCRVIDNTTAVVRGVEALPPITPINEILY